MKHIVRSFQSHVGQRGVHFYDNESCNFLTWTEVLQFVRSLHGSGEGDEFTDKLTGTLANYDPNKEFLAVHQRGNSVSVELYSDISRHMV